LQCRFPIDDVLLRSGDIRDQVQNRAEILMFLGRQISGERGHPNFSSKVTIERVAKFGDDRPSDLKD